VTSGADAAAATPMNNMLSRNETRTGTLIEWFASNRRCRFSPIPPMSAPTDCREPKKSKFTGASLGSFNLLEKFVNGAETSAQRQFIYFCVPDVINQARPSLWQQKNNGFYSVFLPIRS